MSEKGTSVLSQAPSTKRQEGLKQTLRNFLREQRQTPLIDELCPRCGQHMEYIDTTLWFYGEDESFEIRLPVCHCAERSPKQLVA